MFKTLLVPLDRTPLAERAIAPAILIARECGARIELVLARDIVASGAGELPHGATEAEYIETLGREIATGTGLAVGALTAMGMPVDVICRRALEVNADLVVMTSHGRTGVKRAWMGSVADGVVRESAVPVLMLRDSTPDDWRVAANKLFQRILVPLDGSDESSAILSPAAALARCARSSIVLTRVVHPVPAAIDDVAMSGVYPLELSDADETKDMVDDAERQLGDAYSRLLELGVSDVSIDVAVARNVASTVVELAAERHVDLIAMSTHGRGASRMIIGSVADKVIRRSGLPLLLYHPRERAEAAVPVEAERITAPFPALAPG